MQQAFGHLADDRLADRAIVDERLVLHAEHRFLGAVRIAHDAVAEHGRAAGDVGDRLRDPAARTGLGRRDGFARGVELTHECARERHDCFMVSHSKPSRRAQHVCRSS